MKSMLIIDTPKSCYDCPLMAYFETCKAMKKNIAGYSEKRHEECPLFHIPKSREPDRYHSEEYTKGWNYCIQTISSEKKCGNCKNFQKWEDMETEGYCDDGKGVVDDYQRCCGHWEENGKQ